MAARAPGHLALLLMGGHHGDQASSGDDGRKQAAQSVLDAIKADDAESLDAALEDWCHEYDKDDEGGEDESESDEGQ